MCRLQRKWNSSHQAVEKTGQAIALYEQTHRRIAREEGVRHNPVALTMTYKGKNAQFEALSSRAKNDEFLICAESCDKAFLDEFLEQARGWRPLPAGRNSLKYDDCANVVSFACDPALATMYPVVHEFAEWSPFHRAEEEEYQYESRYMRW